MQAGNEAAAIDLTAAGCPVAEPDDVSAMLPQSSIEGEALRVMGERNETRLMVRIIAHKDGELSARHQCARAALYQKLVTGEKGFERWRPREVARVAGVELLPPIRGMNPAELEAIARELGGIAGVEIRMEVTRPAINAKFLAYVAAGSAAGHGVENTGCAKIANQVLDEIAATIAGIGAVAVFASAVEMIEARQVRNGTGIHRGQWQPGIDRSGRCGYGRLRSGIAGTVERVDLRCGHSKSPFEMEEEAGREARPG